MARRNTSDLFSVVSHSDQPPETGSPDLRQAYICRDRCGYDTIVTEVFPNPKISPQISTTTLLFHITS